MQHQERTKYYTVLRKKMTQFVPIWMVLEDNMFVKLVRKEINNNSHIGGLKIHCKGPKAREWKN